eukprot:CAMPEP_0172364778 /NCGR_PEP_ID=MMETSP1060-20121228/7832_1 /TAXON_ID=37318 /ORGANISM="Pseudo-nitzschia pungens, Strain cf. cingulata" /LENGTH=97 /DNA_ID=CAMNT_0013087863 /DNA_START=442 /DNA_END=736 /DNA_ORIENTATION=-
MAVVLRAGSTVPESASHKTGWGSSRCTFVPTEERIGKGLATVPWEVVEQLALYIEKETILLVVIVMVGDFLAAAKGATRSGSRPQTGNDELAAEREH